MKAEWVLWVCDRFRVDPDRAHQLDASVIGLRDAEHELRAEASG